MNVDLSGSYHEPDHVEGGEPISDMMDAHLTMLATSPGMAATAFTGRQALTPETDLPYSYRVWSETVMGTWVWIDTDGIVVEVAAPLVLLWRTK